MATVFIGSSFYASTSNAMAAAVSAPTGVTNGDQLVAIVAQGYAVGQILSAAGWTQHGSQVNVEAGGFGFAASVFTKLHAGETDYAFSSNFGERFAVMVSAFRGASGVDVVTEPAVGSSSSATCPSATTIANAMIVRAVVTEDGVVPHISPDGHTSAGEVDAASGAAASMHYTTQALAGETGTALIPLTSSVGSVGWTLALTPTLDGPPDTIDPIIAIDPVHEDGEAVSVHDAVGYNPDTETLTITGTASDDIGVASIEVSIDGGSYVPATNNGGTWSYELDLSSLSLASEHVLVARSSDAAGNQGVSSPAFFYYSPSGLWSYGGIDNHLMPASIEAYGI